LRGAHGACGVPRDGNPLPNPLPRCGHELLDLQARLIACWLDGGERTIFAELAI